MGWDGDSKSLPLLLAGLPGSLVLQCTFCSHTGALSCLIEFVNFFFDWLFILVIHGFYVVQIANLPPPPWFLKFGMSNKPSVYATHLRDNKVFFGISTWWDSHISLFLPALSRVFIEAISFGVWRTIGRLWLSGLCYFRPNTFEIRDRHVRRSSVPGQVLLCSECNDSGVWVIA